MAADQAWLKLCNEAKNVNDEQLNKLMKKFEEGKDVFTRTPRSYKDFVAFWNVDSHKVYMKVVGQLFCYSGFDWYNLVGKLETLMDKASEYEGKMRGDAMIVILLSSKCAGEVDRRNGETNFQEAARKIHDRVITNELKRFKEADEKDG